MSIHPSSIISSTATIAENVHIGPFCVVEDGACIGTGSQLAGRVTIKSGTFLGENNLIGEGTVLGGLPQHVAIRQVDSQLVIGNGNVFRENVTIHRAMKAGHATILGNDNYLMVNSHVGHDCIVGNNVMLVNNVMLAGHVTVGNRAILAGGAGVHQFCRIGEFAMVGGLAHISQDVPPYVLVDGLTSRVVGLNIIGLRRAGFTNEDISQIKVSYRLLYRSSLTWTEMLIQMNEQFAEGPAVSMVRFLETTQRGITRDRMENGSQILKLRAGSDDTAVAASVESTPEIERPLLKAV